MTIGYDFCRFLLRRSICRLSRIKSLLDSTIILDSRVESWHA